MKRIAAALAGVLLLLTACGGNESYVLGPGTTSSASPTTDTTDHQRTLQIYTTVIRQLVTVDHTFGSGPSPFKHVWVVDHPVPGVGSPSGREDVQGEPFSDSLRADLKRDLSDLPPLDVIADADTVRDMKSTDWEVRDHGVIVTLGPLERHGPAIHVGHEIWCGGACAEWFTYVLQQRSGAWTITGDTGMRAIA
jgi:hypothetical protein